MTAMVGRFRYSTCGGQHLRTIDAPCRLSWARAFGALRSGALAGADHGDPLLAKRVVGEGSRDPVEGVLERAGDGGVVFRSREQHSVRSRDFVLEEGDRLRLDLDVLVVRRDAVEMVPEDEFELG